MIGKIICNYKMHLIKNTIQNGAFETISIDIAPQEIRRLSNGCFISSCTDSITIFDDSFKQLKQIDLDYAVGCAIHNDKNIYITDYDKCCIYLMDNQLKMIKKFGCKGSTMNQFNIPLSICMKDEFLYVCDLGNKRIQILKLNFEYHETIQLDFYPQFIEISNTTIAICGSQGIYFYDKRTKQLKKKYPAILSRISLIDFNFYVISGTLVKNLFIFDHEGELIDEVILENLRDTIVNFYDGYILSTEDYLLVLSNNGEKFLKYKF